MRFIATLFICWSLLVVLPVQSRSDPVPDMRTSGIYTNMRQESKGIYGIEVFILHSKGKAFAVLQFADGQASKPVVVEVSIMQSGLVEFDVPKDIGPWGHFHGVTDGKRLRGTFQGKGVTVDLEKRTSFWQ